MVRRTEAPEVDHSSCADEPIHIPGSIQPHGALIAVVESDMRIVQISENVDNLLGFSYQELLGNSLDKLIGELQLQELKNALKTKAPEALNPFPVQLLSRSNKTAFNALMHRLDELLIIELEPYETQVPVDALEFFRTGYEAMSQTLQCENRQELLNTLAKFTHNLTGFDRVMVYLFDQEWNGSVVAESRNEKLESYLGWYFPASDIPAQARALYAKNRLRLLADVASIPSSIHVDPSVTEHNPLDLSMASLRSMSPIHLEYLRNMRVAASMSISLIDSKGELNGLIACHHATPRHVSCQLRIACDFLAQIGSLKLAELEERENYQRHLKLRETARKLVTQKRETTDLADLLISSGDLLLEVCEATGAAVVSSAHSVVTGLTPPLQELTDIIDYLKENTDQTVFSTDSLSKHIPKSASYKDVASGLLAIKLSENEDQWLLWFRSEQIREIDWAGCPETPFEVDANMKIQPRKSFALWKEQVSGTSRPWSTAEIDTAVEMRSGILEIALSMTEQKSKEQLEQQVKQLSSINLYLESLTAQLRKASDDALMASQRKSEMVSVVSHDLRSPLTAIHASLALLTQGDMLGDDAKWLIETAFTQSSFILTLISDLLNLEAIESGAVELKRFDIPLHDLFIRAVALMAAAAETSDVEVLVMPTNVVVNVDPDRILQVLVNLLSNAIKFSPPGTQVELSAQPLPGQVLVNVKDKGRGIPAEFCETIFYRFSQVQDSDRREKGGTGLGLAICKTLIAAHGGTIGVDSIVGEGSTFWFKLPTSSQSP